MTETNDRPSGPQITEATRRKQADEAARLARALRENLQKRKSQARARDAGDEPG